MRSIPPPRRFPFAAILVATCLVSCTDAPTSSILVSPSQRPVVSSLQMDTVSAPPDDGVVPQGCVEDQQESVVDPATGELIACPIAPIVVVAPPPEPTPPPSEPPSDPPPPPSGGGTPPPSDAVCDPSVDWDPDCARCESGALWDDATQSCIDADDVAELGCPAKYNGQWSFVWSGHTFYVWGVVERTEVIKSWPWGEALYRLPAGPVTSTDGKAVYWSGIGRMKCFGFLNKAGHFEGLLNLVWERGDVRLL